MLQKQSETQLAAPVKSDMIKHTCRALNVNSESFRVILTWSCVDLTFSKQSRDEEMRSYATCAQEKIVLLEFYRHFIKEMLFSEQGFCRF